MLNLEKTFEYMTSWTERVIDWTHPFCWIFWLTSFFVTYLFYRLNHGSRWRTMLSSELQNPKFKKELKFDIKNFFFKFIFDASFFLFLGVSFHSLTEMAYYEISMPLSQYFNNQPLILEGFYGRLLFTIYFFLAWDFAAYCGHFIIHRSKYIWPFHRYHHLADSLNPLTKYRGHPVELLCDYSIQGFLLVSAVLLFRFFVEIPAGIRRLDTATVMVVFYAVLHLRHSFVKLSYGPYLSYIFVSPFMHQIHHSRLPHHRGKNYGITFAFWDSIFGTLYIPKPNEDVLIGDEVLGEKNESVTTELLRPFRDLSLKSKRGMSLIEVMVSLGVLGVLALGSMTLMADMIAMEKKVSANIETDRDFDQAIFFLERYAMFAQNVRFFGNFEIEQTQSLVNEGYIRVFNYRSFADLEGDDQITPIMYFPLDTRMSTDGDIVSDFRGAAVYFREPNKDRPGALLFYTHNVAGNVTIDPSMAILSVEGLVGLRIASIRRSPNGVVLGAEFTLTGRRFVESARTTQMGWCPVADYEDACSGMGKFRDFERKISLNFVNNLRDTDRPSFMYSHGAYIFQPRNL